MIGYWRNYQLLLDNNQSSLISTVINFIVWKQVWTKKLTLYRDNVCFHTKDLLEELGWEKLFLLLYSPDFDPVDFNLFRGLLKYLNLETKRTSSTRIGFISKLNGKYFYSNRFFIYNINSKFRHYTRIFLLLLHPIPDAIIKLKTLDCPTIHSSLDEE